MSAKHCAVGFLWPCGPLFNPFQDNNGLHLFRVVIRKLYLKQKKLLKEFCEIGIFGLISRHDIGEKKKMSVDISPRYMPTKFRTNSLVFSVHF